MGEHRQHRASAHRQHGSPARQNGQVEGGIEAVTLNPPQAIEIAVEPFEQGAAAAQIGDPAEDPARPGQGGKGALLGAADTDQAAGAPVTAEQLDPAAGDHSTDGETEQVEWFLPPEGGFNVVPQQFRGLEHRGAAQPQRQGGTKQRLTAAAKFPLEAVEHLGCVQQTVDQDQRGNGCRVAEA